MAKSKGLLNNLSWKFAERISAQLVTMVVSIILARLLSPSDYGTIAIVNIFITIANVFVSDGLGSALVQKIDADKLDFSSVLWVNILLSIVLYFILFFIAPFITSFFGEGYEVLTPVLRILSLRLILSAINSVQQAYVAREMIFRKFFLATLLGTIASAVVGIYMAYSGYGIWALVFQYLTNTTVDTIILGISLGKLPMLKISFKRLKPLFKFGMPILGTGLLITGYSELKGFLIGKVYTPADLAFYDKGKQFPALIINNVNTSIGSVLYPKLSSLQTSKAQAKQFVRESIRFTSYIMCPMMLGMLAVSETFVRLILTDKWLPCVPLMQLFCIIYLFYPIHNANMQAIKAMGESKTLLRLEIVKKIIEMVALFATLWISVDAVVISLAVITTLFTFLNAYPNKRILNYSIMEQMKDIAPALFMSLTMCGTVIGFGFIPGLSLIVKFIVQIIVGIVVYISLSLLTKNKQFYFVIDKAKGFIKHITKHNKKINVQNKTNNKVEVDNKNIDSSLNKNKITTNECNIENIQKGTSQEDNLILCNSIEKEEIECKVDNETNEEKK